MLVVIKSRGPANRDVRSSFKHNPSLSLFKTTPRQRPQMYVHDQALALVGLARGVGVDAAGLQHGRAAAHRRRRDGTEEGMFASSLAEATQEHG